MNTPVFRIKDVAFSADRINAFGKKANLKYDDVNGSHNVVMQLPKLIAPFGISKYDNKGQMRYTLDLRLEDGTDIKAEWEMIERRIKQIAKANAPDLFGKLVSEDYIDAMFTSSIKESKDGDFPPTLRCVIPNKHGDMEAVFINANGEALEPNWEPIHKGATVEVILELPRIWNMDKQFGCTPIIRCVRIVTNERADRLKYSFLD